MKQLGIYIYIMAAIWLALAVVFNILPRSTWSHLEKRHLASFPAYSASALLSGSYTQAISRWYSDTEPFRDIFMAVSMEEKAALALSVSDDDVTFHAATPTAAPLPDPTAVNDDGRHGIPQLTDMPDADADAKIANAGIIIVGRGEKVRALMAYGGSAAGGASYAEAANEYRRVFGPSVKVYSMTIPTAVEYYCPEKARRCTSSQRATINNIHRLLSPDVYAVDVYTPLGAHVNEDIFLRTDHHWAPLGAYYAAQQFAKIAKVPFRSLQNYQRRVVAGFVGSMYGYSNDISIKKAPEDFVYYIPKGVEYTTTYIDYTLDDSYRIVAESRPCKGPFFYHYKDGNGGAYCTFMGSDKRIVKVHTSTKNGRRLMILKDSFGNAIPGYLFYSFEDIVVVDYRYFTKNMRRFVDENKITDILFANNIFNACSSKIAARYSRFLAQNDVPLPRKISVPKDTALQAKPQQHKDLKNDAETQPAAAVCEGVNDMEQKGQEHETRDKTEDNVKEKGDTISG